MQRNDAGTWSKKGDFSVPTERHRYYGNEVNYVNDKKSAKICICKHRDDDISYPNEIDIIFDSKNNELKSLLMNKCKEKELEVYRNDLKQRSSFGDCIALRTTKDKKL